MHLIKLLQRWPQRKEKSLHHYYHHHRCRQWVLCDSVTGPQMPSLSRVALLAHKQLKDIWPLIPAVWWSEYSLASLLNAGFVQLTSEWYKIGLSFISSRNPLNFEQVICLFVCFLFCFILFCYGLQKCFFSPQKHIAFCWHNESKGIKYQPYKKKKKKGVFSSPFGKCFVCVRLWESHLYFFCSRNKQTNHKAQNCPNYKSLCY